MKNVIEVQGATALDETPDPALAPLTQGDVAAVRNQLEEILSSHHFHTSKRCGSFLRYVVEQTLAGRHDLKERSIGVEAFLRAPTYDSNLDPVVRMTASEVRKRLALYSQDSPRTSDVRIELPVGSYVPRFRFPPAPVAPAEQSVAEPVSAELPTSSPTPLETVSARTNVLEAQTRKPFRKVLFGLLASLIVVLIATGWTMWRTRDRDRNVRGAALDTFWAPLIASPDPTLISIGQIRPTDVQVEPNTQRSSLSGPMDLGNKGHYPREIAVAVLGDAITMTDVAVLLRSHHKQFNIRSESSTSFGELQRGPFILIGAFDNDWTIRMTDPLRFHFVLDGLSKATWISDRQRPYVRYGSIVPGTPVPSFKEDYAVVVRMYDPRTKQPVIIAAGITPFGTQAAGEFLSDPASMAELEHQLPGGWASNNVEVLIKTDLIDGEPGPPSVVSSTTW